MIVKVVSTVVGISIDFLLSKIDKRGVKGRKGRARPRADRASAEQLRTIFAEQTGTGSVDRAKASAEPAERQQAGQPEGIQVFL